MVSPRDDAAAYNLETLVEELRHSGYSESALLVELAAMLMRAAMERGAEKGSDPDAPEAIMKHLRRTAYLRKRNG